MLKKVVIFLKCSYETESLILNQEKSLFNSISSTVFKICFQQMLSNFFVRLPKFFPLPLPEVQSFQITLISFTVKWCVTKEATGPFVWNAVRVLRKLYDGPQERLTQQQTNRMHFKQLIIINHLKSWGNNNFINKYLFQETEGDHLAQDWGPTQWELDSGEGPGAGPHLPVQSRGSGRWVGNIVRDHLNISFGRENLNPLHKTFFWSLMTWSILPSYVLESFWYF